MLHDLSLTPWQAVAIAEWTNTDGAPVQIAKRAGGVVLVGQGDERVIIDTDGKERPA
jgi:hypothetical protein